MEAAESTSRRSEHELQEQQALDGTESHVWVKHKVLGGFASDSFIYVRPQVARLWRELEDTRERRYHSSVESNAGTGKSTAVWAWALWQAYTHESTVAWYRYRGTKQVKVVIDGRRRRIVTGLPADISEIEEQAPVDIMVVDGLTLPNESKIARACTAWKRRAANKNNSYVLVSVVSGISMTCNLTHNVEVHSVPPWTLHDYYAACANEGFFDSVKAKLQCPMQLELQEAEEEEEPRERNFEEKRGAEQKRSNDDTILLPLGKPFEKEELNAQQKAPLLEVKYYFAGGNVRWMFECDFDTWHAEIARALRLTEWTDNWRHNILAQGQRRGRFFISQYVMDQQYLKAKDKEEFLYRSFSDVHETRDSDCLCWAFRLFVDYQLELACSRKHGLEVWGIGEDVATSTTTTTTAPLTTTLDIHECVTYTSYEALVERVRALQKGRTLCVKSPLWSCQQLRKRCEMLLFSRGERPDKEDYVEDLEAKRAGGSLYVRVLVAACGVTQHYHTKYAINFETGRMHYDYVRFHLGDPFTLPTMATNSPPHTATTAATAPAFTEASSALSFSAASSSSSSWSSPFSSSASSACSSAEAAATPSATVPFATAVVASSSSSPCSSSSSFRGSVGVTSTPAPSTRGLSPARVSSALLLAVMRRLDKEQ